MRVVRRRSTAGCLCHWRPAAIVCAWLALMCLPGIGLSRTVELPAHYSRISEQLAVRLPKKHLLDIPLDDAVSLRAWSNYIAALDFDRIYFLAGDIRAFETRSRELDDMLEDGDLGFAREVFEVFRDRVSNRVAYVDVLLDKGFDVEREEAYAWKRKQAPWPESQAAWDELWRKRIKNEYVRIRISREEAVSSPVTAAGLTNRLVDSGLSTNVPLPSIEASIRRRYQQMQTVIQSGDPEWILQNYLSAFTQAYDPHSSYMSPSASEDFQIEMRLSLVGIGALLRSEEGAAKIVQLIPGGPAMTDTRDQRLQPGDKIIAVAQHGEPAVDILHMPLHKVVRLIRGEKGTRVILTVVPASDPTGATTKIVDLIRDEVRLEAQAAKSRVRDSLDSRNVSHKIGIVLLPAFYANMKATSEDDPAFRSAAYDVEQRLQTLKQEGVEGVLLDLRNNSGGSLLEAIRVTGLFIRRGPTVQVKEKFWPRVMRDPDPAIAYSGPLVVLVNRLSASASEIVTAALQDYGRAVIVGDSKTHGKGTVQTVFSMGRDDSYGQLKVTTASYYRITGQSTQLRGVEADILVPSPWDFVETGEEFLDNPLRLKTEGRVSYQPVSDLSRVIARLMEMSQTRRRNHPDFVAYETLLGRVAAMNQAKELPLQIDARRAMAQTEREFSALQDRLAADVEESLSGDAKDLVLQESLAILADLIAIQEEMKTTASPAQHRDPEDSASGLMRWLLKSL